MKEETREESFARKYALLNAAAKIHTSGMTSEGSVKRAFKLEKLIEDELKNHDN